jgi:uncharacterized protein
MVRFWDSSAIVPLFVDQLASDAVQREFESDSRLSVWWGTGLECRSAVARLEREDRLGPAGTQAALTTIVELESGWIEVPASEAVRSSATRLLRTHALRTGDALQLAAAIVAADGDPRTLPLVTLDDCLAPAADKEGFPVLVPGAEG